jgi:hypothetical protein
MCSSELAARAYADGNRKRDHGSPERCGERGCIRSGPSSECATVNVPIAFKIKDPKLQQASP